MNYDYVLIYKCDHDRWFYVLINRSFLKIIATNVCLHLHDLRTQWLKQLFQLLGSPHFRWLQSKKSDRFIS